MDRSPTRRATRRLGALVLVAGLALGGVACGSSGDDEATDDDASASATADRESTTTRDDDEDDEDDDESTATTKRRTSDTRVDDTADVDEPPVTDLEADIEAEDVTWALNAVEYRGEDGTLVAYDCAPDGTLATVWGTDTYTDDSSVCTAAVHAGLIELDEGGRVVIEIQAGEDEYEGSIANGVESLDYASWDGSFTFPAA